MVIRYGKPLWVDMDKPVTHEAFLAVDIYVPHSLEILVYLIHE